MCTPGAPGSASRPSSSTGTKTMLPGMGKSCTGLSFITRPQKSIHRGRAARAPSSWGPSDLRLSSKPTHTPAASEGS